MAQDTSPLFIAVTVLVGVIFLMIRPDSRRHNSDPIEETVLDAVEARVRIGHVWGHGNWFAPENRAWMENTVRDLNRQHGPGTHWIERETR